MPLLIAQRDIRLSLTRVAIARRESSITIVVLDNTAARRLLSGWGDLFLWALFVFVTTAACLGQEKPGESSPKGGEIFAQRCASCHGKHGEGLSGIITIAGPSIKAEHDYGKVMTAVEVGPSHMPSFVHVLSAQDIQAVSHFVVDSIADIPLGPGDLGKGGELFRTHCASCHRTAVRGGAMAYAGVNPPALTDKSAALIAGAVRWGPGPMPSFPPSVLDDKELSSLVTYVRYAQSPISPGGNPLNWHGPVAEGFTAWVVVFALVGIAIWVQKGGRG
jgi:ubiquinol-cytochrome c reductase cytochrome c subunit